MLDTTMYDKTKARQPRANNGWKKRGFNSNKKKGFKKRGFSGDKIDAKLFVNKVDSAEVIKETEIEVKNSFVDFDIHSNLKKAIQIRGFNKPTPIQDQAIPLIIKGGDIIGLANTGTGKTGAFLIPIINKILKNPQERVLIVVPIRELAIQIEEELKLFSQRLKISSVVVVGGANIHRQIGVLRSNPNVVIGTPGRLKDLIERKKLNLSQFKNVVLDEADRMLDMGFINDVKLLLSLLAEKRQTMLFSATFSKQVEGLVRNFLVKPQKISLKTRETSNQIDQDVVKIAFGEDKADKLHGILQEVEFEKVLVFTKTKHGADKLSKKLYQKGFKTNTIHGNKAHNQRQRVLKMFKENSIDILVATDVAARGLDIPNVSHVINFDIPATYDDYVHRIGRTGRANKTGTALTFVG